MRLVEQQRKAEAEALLETAIEYKIGWERELARREKLGISGPAPCPHPGNVLIDVVAGEVDICEAITKEEQDYLMKRVARGKANLLIANLEDEAAERPRDNDIKKNLAKLYDLRDQRDASLLGHPGAARFLP